MVTAGARLTEVVARGDMELISGHPSHALAAVSSTMVDAPGHRGPWGRFRPGCIPEISARSPGRALIWRRVGVQACTPRAAAAVAEEGTAEIGVERPQVVQEGGCPSCGAPVQFTVGAARIKVCESCQTVVARQGEELYATGKLSALAETATPFSIGLEGRHDGVRFRFVGHLQKDYDDGVWDEWYLAFEAGRFGWLSESEGSLHLMFSRGQHPLERRHFRPGHETRYAGRRLVMEEIRQAQLISAE